LKEHKFDCVIYLQDVDGSFEVMFKFR